MRKLILTSFVLILLFISAQGQCPLNSPEVIFMADGGGSTYSWNAGLYNLSQIGNAGNINSISFKLDNPGYANETYNNQYIYMRHTSVTDYNGNKTYPGTSDFTQVWSGTITINSTNVLTINLSTPFNYNGTDMLEVLFENHSGHSPYDELWFDRTDASSSIYNGKFGAGYSWSGATNDSTKRQFNLAIGFNTTTINCNSFESTLPITLKTFTAKKENNTVELDWITASEINNDFFTIEHSTDGVNFKEISKINGAGNSNEQKTYKHIHKNVKKGLNYYRLKQTDFDGTYTYSKIKAVRVENTEINIVNIYPNPANNNIKLKMSNKQLINTIEISDITGKIIKNFKNTQNLNIINLDIINLKKGLYFVRVNNTKPIKLVKQ